MPDQNALADIEASALCVRTEDEAEALRKRCRVFGWDKIPRRIHKLLCGLWGDALAHEPSRVTINFKAHASGSAFMDAVTLWYRIRIQCAARDLSWWRTAVEAAGATFKIAPGSITAFRHLLIGDTFRLVDEKPGCPKGGYLVKSAHFLNAVYLDRGGMAGDWAMHEDDRVEML